MIEMGGELLAADGKRRKWQSHGLFSMKRKFLYPIPCVQSCRFKYYYTAADTEMWDVRQNAGVILGE